MKYLKYSYLVFATLITLVTIAAVIDAPTDGTTETSRTELALGVSLILFPVWHFYMFCFDKGHRDVWGITLPLPFAGTAIAFVVRSKRKKREFDASPEGQRLIREKKEEAKRLYDDLVDIAGVSDKVARTLMDQYPTIQTIKQATAEQLTDIPGVGLSVAKAIKARLG